MNANNQNKIYNYKGIYESGKEKYNLFRTNRYMTDYLFSDNNKHKIELSKSTSRRQKQENRTESTRPMVLQPFLEPRPSFR